MFRFILILALLAVPFQAQAVEVAGSGHKEVLGTQACTVLTVGTTDTSVTLKAGQRYRVFATTDVYLRVGAVATTSGTSVLVGSRTPEPFVFAPTGTTAPVVHGITSAGTGTVQFCPIIDGR